MFLNLNFAEWLVLRNRAARMAFSVDQTQAPAGVFAAFLNRFLDDGAPPGVPMN